MECSALQHVALFFSHEEGQGGGWMQGSAKGSHGWDIMLMSSVILWCISRSKPKPIYQCSHQDQVKLSTMAGTSIIFIALSLAALLSPTAKAAVPCNSTHNPCEELLFEGSKCKNGFCTNPFQGGCLRPLLESDEYRQKYGNVFNLDKTAADEADDGDSKANPSLEAMRRRLLSVMRVCNSEDPPEAEERGICSPNTSDYPEVRLWSQNWEGAFVLAWMMQIIYSELLGVPSTIETGVKDVNANFYNEFSRMEYGKANEYEMFWHAYEAEDGDCSMYKEKNEQGSPEEYVPCAHAAMEIYHPNRGYHDAEKAGHAEPLQFVGIIASELWYITQFSIARDPSLATSFGLQGEQNRRKLAETFKRPATWKDYCHEVSLSNCTKPDDVAQRPPANDGSEDGRYYDANFYTGYFRMTEKNDCNKTEKCTGHFLDYPCGWTSFFKQQAHHLNIALESGGDGPYGAYTYGEMVEIWLAANRTRSNVMGIWWTPEPTATMFKQAGSDLVPVALPQPTQECVDHRIDTTLRCDLSATEFDLFGDEKGACGRENILVQKAAVGNMQDNIRGNKNPKSQMSPAYDVYKLFSVTALQQDQILTEWVQRRKDKYNFDLRYATCKWMADNLEHIIDSVIPEDHPRAFVEGATTSPLTITALLFSAIAIILSISTVCGIIYIRHKGSLARATQIEFLLLLLAGLLLVSIGSLLMALEPSDSTCIGAIWMLNVGYTLELVPTLIRVWAIISIVKASLKMKVVKVDKKMLLTKSIGVSAIAALYCTLWTALDSPCSKESIVLTRDKNELGETIVSVSSYCSSESDVWYYVMIIGQGFLLLCASILAFQMRSVPNSVNDSLQLAVMIYSSFIFLVLRLICYVLGGYVSSDKMDKSSLQVTRSLLCSLDTIVNILIFFPRFFIPKVQNNNVHISRFRFRSHATNGSAPETPGTDVAAAESQDTRVLVERSSIASGANDETDDRRLSRVSQIIVDEEKEEDGAEEKQVHFILHRGRSVSFPNWVVSEYGQWNTT